MANNGQSPTPSILCLAPVKMKP
ncbi:uncharacterized protein G2W53_006468 [Senna tora]|uniref:Uncharacterized protein n=1 Tax=Senna tora TaxID=362788 RepID=A0A835CCI4_9FABA|nr:uncharacterized protein G2W53_006468 [Senna tora]